MDLAGSPKERPWYLLAGGMGRLSWMLIFKWAVIIYLYNLCCVSIACSTLGFHEPVRSTAHSFDGVAWMETD